MRVGIRDADRLKDSPSSAPVCALGHLPPHSGEGFGAAQIGRDWSLCGTFGYIYWEFGWSAPVGGRAAQCAAPTAKTWQAQAARPGGRALQKGRRGQVPALCRCNPLTSLGFCLSSAPFWWAGEETRPCGGVRAKNAGAQCAPLQERRRETAPSSVWPTASHLPPRGKAWEKQKGTGLEPIP